MSSRSLHSTWMVAAMMAVATPLSAQDRAPQLMITTLGTMGGPIPSAGRSQPASLIDFGDQRILVDVGDGAPEQLAKVGVMLAQVQTLFITHAHFDHIGGLFALLGMRYQAAVPGKLTIYAPPGTKAIIQALLVAMSATPVAKSPMRPKPAAGVDIVEIQGGSAVTVGAVRITAVENTHYGEATGNGSKDQSLSYRFDAPGRSIAYTGDTGPSTNVEQLAKGVDLLVSELIDPDTAMADLKKANPNFPTLLVPIIARHFVQEHLTAEEVRQLAQKAGVKKVVITHSGLAEPVATQAKAKIAKYYAGPVTVANDLDHY